MDRKLYDKRDEEKEEGKIGYRVSDQAFLFSTTRINKGGFLESWNPSHLDLTFVQNQSGSFLGQQNYLRTDLEEEVGTTDSKVVLSNRTDFFLILKFKSGEFNKTWMN